MSFTVTESRCFDGSVTDFYRMTRLQRNTLVRRILKKQDEKIRRYLETGEKTHFFFAGFPRRSGIRLDGLIKAHQMDFDNYPFGKTGTKSGFLFFESLIGSRLRCIDNQTDSFHVYCEPCIQDPAEISRLSVDLDTNPVWTAHLNEIADSLQADSADPDVPVPLFGLSIFDCACNLCSAERLFIWMLEHEDHVHRLLDFCSDLYIECFRRLQRLGYRIVTSYGFPGVYCNDLHLRNLSPQLIERFVLPQYIKIAKSCGAMLLNMGFADLGLVEKVLSVEQIIGCAFDRRIPLDTIKRIIGRKLFLIHNYIYYDWLDKPTLINGIYCNPIVQTYGRELPQAFTALSETCSMLVYIERHTLNEIQRVKDRLLQSSQVG